MPRLRDTGLDDFVGSVYEHVTDYTDFGVDIARLGASEVVLVIDADVNVTGTETVPNTLKFKWIKGAKLINDGGSIDFEGNPFVYNQEMGMEALFSGFAANDITFSGDIPKDISSEIAHHADDSLTTRLHLLTNWFASPTKFHCFPRPITSVPDAVDENVVLSDYHSLYFRPGVFTNSYDAGGLLGRAVFELGSYASFSSEQGAEIQSSSVNDSPQIVHTKTDCIGSVIENNRFVHGGGSFDGASFGVAIAPGSFDCHIRNNRAEGIRSYQFGISSDGGNAPSYCTIDGNYCSGFMTQNIALIGGRHCKIINNIFDFKDLTNGNAYATFIDIEPNDADDVISDLLIENNEIDFRGTTLTGGGDQFAVGIFVQGVNTPGVHRVTIRNNRFLCDDDGRMQSAVFANGVTDLTVENNRSFGVGYIVNIAQCNGFVIRGNRETSPNRGNVFIAASGYGLIHDNLFRSTSAVVEEIEMKHPVESAGGTLLTLLNPWTEPSAGRVYESYIGLTVTYNDVDYVIASVDVDEPTYQKLDVTAGPLPTLNYVPFDPTDINTGTEVINVPGHGFADLAFFQWFTTGTPPTGITNNQGYFIIRVDADNVKVATTRANAVAGTAFDFTDQGTGEQVLVPVFATKFSNNKYRDNNFATYTLAGTSANNGGF